jgi:hypothetical protein
VKIYDIAFEVESAFAIYEALVTDAAGEVTPEVEEAERNLKALLEQGADKIESAACVIRNLESESIALKAEAARLMERGQTAQKSADRLKQLIGFALPALGGKVKTPKFTCWIQKNPTSYDVEIHDGVDPMDVARQWPDLMKVEAVPRKSLIVERVKQGAYLPAYFHVTEKPETFSTRIK